MQLRQLRHLVALAERGSFGGAAEASHLSQPALSRSIENLEESLKTRLVDRAYGTVRFTAAGELVLARAREMLANAAQIQRDVLKLDGLLMGSLHVGLGPFAAATPGRAALAQLTRQYPQLTARVEVADTITLCERLQRRQIDLFIADTRDLVKQPGLKIERLPNTPVAFFVRARHPLLKLKRVTVDRAMDFPIASPNLPGIVTTHFDSLSSRTDRAFFNVACDDSETLRHLALEADALILIPVASVAAGKAAALLPVVIEGQANMLTRYSLVTLAARTLSPAANAYAQLVRETMTPVAPASQAAGQRVALQ
ncbi:MULTISPECIES: LysR family transcriptional regulator [unclassified Variovorax]|uniref:LysR family transcriptional regulator n=1 Tax=unclassified Variovorax TaxID=663243 RepID=UPI001BD32373|nr:MULTISPECIES: LysR family transcriptional regulator [unclassified Variovorax]